MLNLSDITMDEVQEEPIIQEVIAQDSQETETPESTSEDKELILAVQVDELKAKMEAATIEDEPQYEAACEWLKDLKKKIKEVEGFYEDDRKRTHEAYKAVTGKIKKLKDILVMGERIVKGKINVYLDEKERLQRIEEEKRRKEEEAKRKELEAKKAENPDALEEEPDLFTPPEEVAPAPAPVPVGQNTAGVSFAQVWGWELEDISKVPMDYLMVDEKKLNGVVKAMKGDTKIPGIKVFQKRQVRA